MDPLSATFSALADPTRRAILARLAEGSATVNELAEPFDISLPAVSRHLKVLESANLIRREVEKQKRRCFLQPQALKTASDWVDLYSRMWTESLDGLEKYLDDLKQAKD
ncbi:ArsR/SmtB family transcription factor [Aestuariispira insulae]|uniref:ArsR family transcriptional regulator n=1 Tax=Aestuariispira insulae TaxID=1461337 RepID=A0A3D9HXT5_9PROT|nr:metalloregulator ArsR/SmtB family transcription factor [Aestuariispira insulae]RED54230.1 ArsR family transcriptional regulator [Aestuariispira insulae]